MATMDDIAKVLGVSKSTVSKALSGAGDVSESMRRTVLETAVELRYTRVSRGAAAPRIAIFITNMRYKEPEDFGYDIIVGFRKLAEPTGFRVELIDLDYELQTTLRYDEYMVLNNFRGGIFLGLSLVDPWIRDFEVCRTPTVLYDNHIVGNPNVTHVGVDNAEGMGFAVAYLKSLGHEKIGYLSSALQAYVYRQRFDAFFLALRKNNLTADESLSGNSYHMSECLTEHLPRLLQAGCTAIVCSHDALAHQVMTQCAAMGIRVPRDLSVLGFDDLPMSHHSSPTLTTVRQNRDELGRSIFCALSSQINRVPISTLLLHTELIRRESCAEAAV